MINISSFSSLIFKDYVNYFEEKVMYIQSFSQTDIIRVQLFTTKNPRGMLVNLESGMQTEITPVVYGFINTIYFDFRITGAIGSYEFRLVNEPGDIYARSRFCILDDSCLEHTVKLSYSNRQNRYDTIFIDPDTGSPINFDIRFEGGFIYRDNSYKAEEEQFRDQDYSGHVMSAFPYYNSKLTIGKSGEGVPEWTGLKLNSIFSLSKVKINGEECVKSTGAEPERIELAPYYPLYVWKLDVEPSSFYSDKFDLPSDYTPLTDNFSIELTDNYGNLLTTN